MSSSRHLLIAPTAFKGTLSAVTAGRIMQDNLALPGWKAEVCPVADGGDDTLACLQAAGLPIQLYSQTVCGPVYPHTVSATYGIWPDRRMAVIEAAQAHGLVRLPEGRLAPMTATSYGVGALLKAVIEKHPEVSTLVVTLGGSASTDGGAGALQALGMTCYDEADQLLPAPLSGQDLPQIRRVALPNAPLQGRSLFIATDVENPLVGPSGAAEVFAPQKGADAQGVQQLAQGLAEFSRLMEPLAPCGLHRHTPRTGAAGGLAFGLACLPGASLFSGFEWLASALGLKARVAACDAIVTGEGRLDASSLSGKVCGSLLDWAPQWTPPKALGIVCGTVAPEVALPDYARAFPMALDAEAQAWAIREPEAALENALKEVRRWLEFQ